MSNLAAGICFHRAPEEVQADEARVAVLDGVEVRVLWQPHQTGELVSNKQDRSHDNISVSAFS